MNEKKKICNNLVRFGLDQSKKKEKNTESFVSRQSVCVCVCVC